MSMTEEERDELAILTRASETGKVGIPIQMSHQQPRLQFALERLQMRGWLILIDVTPLPAQSEVVELPRRTLYRIYKLSLEAAAWMEARRDEEPL